MPTPEFIERNASLARSFSPLSQRERRRLVESIDVSRQHAMLRFFRDHVDA